MTVRIYNLFCELFEFRENISNNRFREITKAVHKVAKFQYFAKQIIYSESPGYALQNYV